MHYGMNGLFVFFLRVKCINSIWQIYFSCSVIGWAWHWVFSLKNFQFFCFQNKEGTVVFQSFLSCPTLQPSINPLSSIVILCRLPSILSSFLVKMRFWLAKLWEQRCGRKLEHHRGGQAGRFFTLLFTLRLSLLQGLSLFLFVFFKTCLIARGIGERW